MKTRTAFLFICALIFSLTAFGQNQDINISSSTDSETRVDLLRSIRLVKDSKPEEVMVNIKQETLKLDILISSSVNQGKLLIELYDPNDAKQGNFTVGTQLNSENKENVSGRIQKSLNEPQPGNWKVKIIPSEATGNIRIQTIVIE